MSGSKPVIATLLGIVLVGAMLVSPGAAVATAPNELVDPPSDTVVTPASVTTDASVFAASRKSHTVELLILDTKKVKKSTDLRDEAKAAVKNLSSYFRTVTNRKISSIKLTKIRQKKVSRALCSDPDRSIKKGARTYGRSLDYYYKPTKHLIVLVTENCTGWYGSGLASMGRSVNSGGWSWVNINSQDPESWGSTLTHEFGHNLSLNHSSVLRCNGSKYDVSKLTKKKLKSNKCKVKEYYDFVDPMGMGYSSGFASNNIPAALSVSHRVQLKVMTKSSLRTVTNKSKKTHTVKLMPITNKTGTRGVAVKHPTTGEKYYVEFRNGTGLDKNSIYKQWNDSFESSNFVDKNVRIMRLSKKYGSVLMLRKIDAAEKATYTHQLGDFSSKLPYFKQGDTFKASGGKFTITVTSITDDAAKLEIKFK